MKRDIYTDKKIDSELKRLKLGTKGKSKDDTGLQAQKKEKNGAAGNSFIILESL